MTNTYIAIQDYTRLQQQIEPDFIRALHQSGLIHCQINGQDYFIDSDELPQIEQYARLHYDLDINLEGIEAIAHLLLRMEALQQEIRNLHNRMAFYAREHR